jgi:hypothetical protein
VYSIPPNLRKPKANCTAMTMPMNTLVTVTMPTDATPSASICCKIARPSKGRRKPARTAPISMLVTAPMPSSKAPSLPSWRSKNLGGGGGIKLRRSP